MFNSQTFNSLPPLNVLESATAAACGTDLMARGMAWLDTMLTAHLSQPIAYARGFDAVDLCSAFGKKLLKLDDGVGGFVIEWTDMDFIIPAASLVLSGVPITPEPGDMVYARYGDDVHSFELAQYGGEPCWRWCDPYHTRIRVHAKFVGSEPYS